MAGLYSEGRSSVPAAIRCFYGDFELIPVPLIDYSIESIRPDGGTKLAEHVKLTLQGAYVLPSGSFERVFLEGQQRLLNIFRTDYQPFSIIAGPGNKTLPEGYILFSGLYPRVTSINSEPDIWVNLLRYTVELEVYSGIPGNTLNNAPPVESYSDNWSYSENSDNRTIDVTHTINAKGINTAVSGTNAHINALSFVKPRVGLSNTPAFLSFYTEPSVSGGYSVSMQPISTKRSESINIGDGTYEVNEVFVVVSGTVTAFDARTSSFEENEQKIAAITINGVVQGLGRTNLNTTGGIGFTNALSYFQNTIQPAIPLDASGVYLRYKSPITGGSGLNVTIPITTSITENRFLGTIQYSYSFNDDPSRVLPSGILELQTSITRVEALKLFASHAIPFRRIGNIIQAIETTTEGTITVTTNARAVSTGNKVTDTNLAIITTENEINRFRPNSANFITLRLNNVTQTYSDSDLSSQVVASWTFTLDKADTPNADSAIVLKYL